MDRNLHQFIARAGSAMIVRRLPPPFPPELNVGLCPCGATPLANGKNLAPPDSARERTTTLNLGGKGGEGAPPYNAVNPAAAGDAR